MASFRSRLESGPAFMSVERTSPARNAAGQTTWAVRRAVGPSPDGPWTPAAELTFVVTAAGDAAIAEEINHEEKVELVFDPPLIIMPAELPAGSEPFTQETYLRVYPLGNRQQTKAKGPVHQRIAHDGGAVLTIDAGPRRVQKVIQTFEASLRPAEVRNITRQWFIPGVGLVGEERTRIFGVQTRLNRESWILVDHP
jgi:hypothetical protein